MGTFINANFVCLKSRMNELRNELNCGSVDKKRVLESLLNLVLKNSCKSFELYESDRRRNMFEDNGFIQFDKCKIYLNRLKEKIVRDLITKLCISSDSVGVYMNLEREELQQLFSFEVKPLHRMKDVASFALGTIVNAITFVSHFESIDTTHELSKIMNKQSIVDFEHDKNLISFYFRCDTLETNHSRFKSIRYKMEIRYEYIRSLICSPNKQTMTMYLVLKCPPLLFQSLEDNINFERYKKMKNKCDEITPSDEWVRTSDFDVFGDELYGKCNVLKLDIPLIKNPDKLIHHKNYECPWSLITCLPTFRDIPVYFTDLRQSSESAITNINLVLNKNSIPDESEAYDIRYALECIQSYSWQLVDELIVNKNVPQFKKVMNKFAQEDVYALEDVLYLLYDAIQTSHFINIFESLQVFFVNRRKLERPLHKNPKNSIMFKRVAITPTRTLVLPKLPYKQSIFAHEPPEGSDQESFMYRAEYAVRAELKNDDLSKLNWSMFRIVNWELELLQMKEEDEGRLNTENKRKLEELEEVDEIGEKLVNSYLEKCIKQRLINGLNICGRDYRIFGSSPSQMKEFGMILYAKDCRGHTAEDVRLSLGDVYKEKNVAKFVTRVGLSLSEVEEFVDVSNVAIDDDVDDIIGGEDNKYIFSDGCGMISPSLAKIIFEKLKDKNIMKNLKEPPSAYQIRIGGSKGMLVINPNLEGHQIKIRKSMRKYKSENMSLLGIVGVSNVKPVHLNRPFVMLLDQLGTNRKYLTELFRSNLNDVCTAFVDDDSARDLLYNHSTLSRYVNMALLSRSGIRLLEEPFFRMCLESIIVENVRKMKEKARIKIDRNFGRSMFGVIDETYTLTQGQIFVRYTDANDSTKKTVLTGRILVTKFPCLHPGDVQAFEAVDVKELYHIVDCIVFPAKGERPHPDEMAGSDLDGDEYAVIWDKRLYPKKTSEPMDYTGEEGHKVEDRITDEDIVNFFGMFVNGRSIGNIADAHLAWADYLEEGVFDNLCLSLARKHATALDFAKTGKTTKLDQNEIVTLFPDFMERENRKGFYISKSVLGDIYRNVKFIERGIITDIPLDFGSTNNTTFHHSNMSKYLETCDAESAYNKYAMFVHELQYRYKIMSETSIIFGITDTRDEFLISSEQSNDLGYKIRDLVREMFASLKEDFEEEFKHRTDEDVEQDKLAKASAYYVFTANCSDPVKYYGLPWLFSEYLAILASVNSKGEKRNYSDDLYEFLANKINVKLESGMVLTTDERVSKVREFFQLWLNTYSKQLIHLSQQLMKTEINKALELETVSIIYGDDDIEMPTGGEIIVNILRKFSEQVFNIEDDLTNQEKNIKRALGLSALTSLQTMYRSRDTNLLTQHKPLVQNLQFQLFHLPLKNQLLKDVICINEKLFKKKMEAMSGVRYIYGRSVSRGNQHFYYLSAFGTPVSLQALTLVIGALHTKTAFDLNALFLTET